MIIFFFFVQILTNVQTLTEAVLTPVTTLLAHSLVPVQVAWSWILANEAAKVILNFQELLNLPLLTTFSSAGVIIHRKFIDESSAS